MVNESSHCVAYLVILPAGVHSPPPLKKKVHRQHILLDLHPGGVDYSLIWPRRGCAAEQGVVFWVLRLTQDNCHIVSLKLLNSVCETK